MPYKKSEKASVEDPVVRYAKSLGIEVVKMNPMYSAGWPDRMFLMPAGSPLFIEFKRPGGKTTALQDHRIEYLRSNGYDVYVIDTKEEGKAVVRAGLEARRLHEKGDAVHPGKPGLRPVPRSRAAKD